MVRQIAPSIALRADTLYDSDPNGMEKKTKQLEAQQLAIEEAEAADKVVTEKASKAGMKAKNLKSQRQRFK